MTKGTSLLRCSVILPSQGEELGIRTLPTKLVSHYPPTWTLSLQLGDVSIVPGEGATTS